MAKYRKKPVVIEAFEWTGGIDQIEDLEWIVTAMDRGEVSIFYRYMFIGTLEGRMKASPGDWIIRGIQGEIYPCKPDIFEQTYESVEDLP